MSEFDGWNATGQAVCDHGQRDRAVRRNDGVCFVAFLVAPENAYLTLGIILASFLILSILVLGVIPRVPLPTERLSWFRGRRGGDQYVGYSPKISKPTYDTFGTNAPPTVDEVRDHQSRGEELGSVADCGQPVSAVATLVAGGLWVHSAGWWPV